MTLRFIDRPGLFGILFCWMVSCSIPAIAADILQIETETSVSVSGDRLNTKVLFTNKGTAPAYDVQVHLDVLDKQEASPVVPNLDPGQSKRVSFERDVAGVREGRYPMTVRVDFHDANQYPFSALSGMTFHVGDVVNPDLAVTTQDITLNRRGTLHLNIKNLGTQSEQGTATLVLPKELSSPQPRKTFRIDQRSDQGLDFHIHNFSALPGAIYPIFCFFEYDSGKKHHTRVARALVTVAKDESLFRRFRWIWMALAAALAAFLIIVFLKERRKKSQGPHESDISR